jgi:folate-binding protein YgfZ
MPDPTPLPAHAAQAGATFAEEAGYLIPEHFGPLEEEHRAARTAAVLFERSHEGKLEAAGAEALTFLHNLCTNDVRGLAAGAGCEALFCTATAKVLAHAVLFRGEPQGKREVIDLDVAPGLAGKLLKHLDRYLISEDVTLTDRTTQLAQFHLAGPEAPAVLARAVGAGADLAPWRQAKLTGPGGTPLTIRRRDVLALPGFDLLCHAEGAADLWRALAAAGARPAGRAAFEVLRVEAGAPVYGVDIDEATFAPEVGLALGAISYAKGCYLGQEPIVMARDRGQVNRALVGLRFAGGLPEPGSALFRDGKEVGRVTSVAQSPELGAVGLGYARRGHQAPGTALEVGPGEPRGQAVVSALPIVGSS